jgi:hypothetical protein
MTSTPAHNPDAHAALADLAMVAAGFVRGNRPRGATARGRLLTALHHANEVLSAGKEEAFSADAFADPEQLVRAYIEAGGNWQKLVATVSRLSLEGATRRHE